MYFFVLDRFLGKAHTDTDDVVESNPDRTTASIKSHCRFVCIVGRILLFTFCFGMRKVSLTQLLVKPHSEGLTHTETIELACTYLPSGEIDDIEMVFIQIWPASAFINV